MYDEERNEQNEMSNLDFVLVNEEEKTEPEVKTEEVQSTAAGAMLQNETAFINIPYADYQGSTHYVVAEEIMPKKKGAGIKRFFKRSIAITVSAAVFGVVAAGCFQLTNDRFSKEDSSVQVSSTNETDTSAEEGQDLSQGSVIPISNEVSAESTDVSKVVEDVMPAVVSINCTGEEVYNYFGRQYSQEIAGSGSGIIIGQNASEILIVTNNHVISGASKVEVVFADGSSATAAVKGTEPGSDLAVLSVNVIDLSKETLGSIKIATLGNSDNVKLGEMAIAIGNALGYGQSVTVGYISALNREVTIERTTLNLLQTDAAINPGNSGGALLNIKGEVIGINSLKYADTNVEGIGYAIPITEVVPIINELMNREELSENESGYLGISGQDVTEEYAKGLNMPIGVYVDSVAENSPAEKAGLKQYDIITKFNDKSIASMADLQRVLSYTKAGTEVELTVMYMKDGIYTEKTLTALLGNRPQR